MPKKHDSEGDYNRYILKKKLNVLKGKKGFHTGLISLMIPPSRKISDVTSYLKSEIGESSNIKSKGNRKNVIDSITALLGKLRVIKKVPENGLLMYSGQIPEDNKPGTEKGEIYIIEPPEPITTFKYYCASEFLLDPLYDMVNEKGSYGIINIENKEGAIGWIRGSHLEICKTMTSGVHSKHHAGGQSQRRLERLIEEGAHQFYKRVAEISNTIFLELTDLQGIFVSGAGMTKEKFVKRDLLDYRLKDKILDFVDVSYSGEGGIRETVLKIQDKIQDLRYVKEKKLHEEFMGHIATDDGLATYGEEEVRKAIMMGAAAKVLLSEDLNKIRLFIACSKCGHEEQKTVSPHEVSNAIEEIRSRECPKCKSNLFQVQEEIDLVEDLGNLAREQGTTIEIVSNETEGGVALIYTFGGIAAILRFKISGF